MSNAGLAIVTLAFVHSPTATFSTGAGCNSFFREAWARSAAFFSRSSWARTFLATVSGTWVKWTFGLSIVTPPCNNSDANRVRVIRVKSFGERTFVLVGAKVAVRKARRRKASRLKGFGVGWYGWNILLAR